MSFTNNVILQRRRISTFGWLLVLFAVVLVIRLVYLQVISHGRYLVQASNEHTRKYEIPAKRGELFFRDGDTVSPVALNQSLTLVYADPRYVPDKQAAAKALAGVLGGDPASYVKKIDAGIEYAVLAERVPAATAAKVKALNLAGIGFSARDYRGYPEGTLGAQSIGFVNADGQGQYGIEGYLDSALAGTPGQLAAKTDTHGIPIATADNVVKPPVDGQSYVMTLDRNIQAMVEQALAEQVQKVKAKSGSVVVMDPSTGAVRAMANYPTFDPNNYSKVSDYGVFTNQAVSGLFEPGSGVKTFTMATGLDQGKITPTSTYDDPGCYMIDDRKVCNAAGDKTGNGKTMIVVLRDSLNTGVMHVLRLLGGDPNKFTLSGKQILYSYFTKHFGFGTRTGIEQSNEVAGSVIAPSNKAGNDVTYANMSFGQGMSVTMVQMVAAMAAIANGGHLYQPRLVDGVMKSDGTIEATKPKLVNDHVMSPKAAKDLNEMLQVVVNHGSGYRINKIGDNSKYKIAGKTGTAQIPKSDGTGYIEGANIGSFVGYAPADAPRFALMVRIDQPQVAGYAEDTTVPLFGAICDWLFKYYSIPPSQ